MDVFLTMKIFWERQEQELISNQYENCMNDKGSSKSVIGINPNTNNKLCYPSPFEKRYLWNVFVGTIPTSEITYAIQRSHTNSSPQSIFGIKSNASNNLR